MRLCPPSQAAFHFFQHLKQLSEGVPVTLEMKWPSDIIECERLCMDIDTINLHLCPPLRASLTKFQHVNQPSERVPVLLEIKRPSSMLSRVTKLLYIDMDSMRSTGHIHTIRPLSNVVSCSRIGLSYQNC